MGVNGLWTVIQPCARPTNLATLNRKRLAVDASIWIYQFLKAVRDKEGNALRNSHIVGFFRRICKLLWFGILPVFVFDGGAPALKRATILKRQHRREGRRDDAVRTAGKLLAVQMQRVAIEEEERRKRRPRDDDVASREARLHEADAAIAATADVGYMQEIGMSEREKTQSRRFHKQDAYHLPELDGAIASTANPDDPRIMSVEELDEYARQFHNGEDVNLYDFSNIDFDGDFFRSLPAPDRYNILNAARLRSRLRMGLSKEQLDDMFPDRMAFSRFQIERVRERNKLTQRLMAEVGMQGVDLTLAVGARVAGEKDREYILVKNEGAEGGWALGVVSKEKDIGEAHKPIDVDAMQVQYQTKDEDEDLGEDEDEDDFEDVPIEGLNRLPKPALAASMAGTQAARDGQHPVAIDDDDSLFVGGNTGESAAILQAELEQRPHPEEQENLERAIALSLRSQHDLDGEDEFEDVPMAAPEWTQKAVQGPRPIAASSGSMIAHIVNNRASAAVPKRKEAAAPADSDSDGDDDVQTILARSLKAKAALPRPAAENKRNPFDGPLPFPKLDWRRSLFARGLPGQGGAAAQGLPGQGGTAAQDLSGQGGTAAQGKTAAQEGAAATDAAEDAGGGFEVEQQPDQDGPRPLPPWLADGGDIRESLKRQQSAEREINEADRREAEEEERLRQRELRDSLIEIESSSDESDVQVVEPPSLPDPEAGKAPLAVGGVASQDGRAPSREAPRAAAAPELWERGGGVADAARGGPGAPAADLTAATLDAVGGELAAEVTMAAPEAVGAEPAAERTMTAPEAVGAEPAAEPTMTARAAVGEGPAAEPTMTSPAAAGEGPAAEPTMTSPAAAGEEAPLFDEVSSIGFQSAPRLRPDGDAFADVEYDEFSDAEDEELMMQMAEEAEEHARFASELNQKSAAQNRDDYEKELRALRSQQKKDRRDADEVTQVMVTECQSLLGLFGIPYITAPMEAEAQCAELVRLGIVDGIVTDDSDTFLFGGTRVYKNMFNSNKFVECYLGADLEEEMSLSREQLISLAQLLGSDYTEGLPGVGPVTAVEILSEFPGRTGLDDFCEWWAAVQSQARPKEADASSPFRRKFRKSQATKLFLPPGFPSAAVYEAYLQPQVDDSAEPFQWGVPDVEGLRRFLMATIGWSKERTDEVLVPVVRDMNRRDAEGTQSNITRFFGGGVGVGAKEAFAPRQRAQGSKRMLAAVDRLRAKAGRAGADAGGARGSSKRRRTATGEAAEGAG